MPENNTKESNKDNSRSQKLDKSKKSSKSKVNSLSKRVLKPKLKSKATIAKIQSQRPIIIVKDLIKDYKKYRAVDGISFEVRKGEVFGILGPNGAGKTTTLEIIETIKEKTSGKVLVDGLDIDVYPKQVKQSIGIQLQSGGFYPRLNLIEQIELFSDIYGINTKPKELLETVNLYEKRYDSVEQLSGGQKQRFSIATTLIANPSIVFLDEPTTGLDPQSRRNIWETVKYLKRIGKTIVLTTHYMEEAEILCDRVAIMDNGKILDINTPENFVKELLARGFSKKVTTLEASLEDVFLDLTGKKLRD